MRSFAVCLLAVVPCLCAAPPVLAGGGPLGIDSQLNYDNSGIFARTNQNILIYSLMGAVGVSALWEGGEDRFGKTSWQAVDSGVSTGIAAYVLKYAFSRERPDQTNDPNKWFTGHGQSFPSGEVTTVTALVTPYMLEYGKDNPAVYALALLPVYDGYARMKVRGHWQTDVIAGAGLGFAGGYFVRKLPKPLVLSIMPRGIQIGLKRQF